jgi:hypothetical protein
MARRRPTRRKTRRPAQPPPPAREAIAAQQHRLWLRLYEHGDRSERAVAAHERAETELEARRLASSGPFWYARRKLALDLGLLRLAEQRAAQAPPAASDAEEAPAAADARGAHRRHPEHLAAWCDHLAQCPAWARRGGALVGARARTQMLLTQQHVDIPRRTISDWLKLEREKTPDPSP